MKCAASISLSCLLLAGCATFGSSAPDELSALEGEWSVDLRPSLDDAPYSQPMRLDIDEDRNVSGLFYGSDILAGRAGTGQGRACVAFRTSDNSGPYQHSACLEGDAMVGQTWSEGRGFVLPWTATRN